MSDISYLAGLLFHNLTDVFAGGRSEVKLFMFFGFFVLICILTLPFFRKQAQKIKLSGKALLITVGTSFLYNIGLLVYFFCKFGFKISDYVVVFHNNEISSTTVLHNHVGKGFNGILLQLFSSGQQENIDTGLAFAGLVPTVLLIVGGLLMLASAVLLIIRFLQNYELNKKWRALQIVIFAILGFSLLKNMLDGGLLNREAPVAIAGLLMLDAISRKKHKALVITSALIVPGYAVLMLLLGTAKLIDLNFWLTTVFLTAIFASVTVTLLYWFWQKKTTRLGVLLIVLSLTFLYIPISEAWNAHANSQIRIPNTGAYVGIYNNPVGSGAWEQLDTINKLRIYRYTPKADGETASQLLKQNNLLSNIGPVTLPWQFCVPTSRPQTIGFEFTTETQNVPQNSLHKFVQIIDVKFVRNNKGLNTYAVKANIDECAPRVLNQLEEIFKEQGFQSFFISRINTNIDEPYGGLE